MNQMKTSDSPDPHAASASQGAPIKSGDDVRSSCQHCGVSNRPWAKMCWMCHAPLGDVPNFGINLMPRRPRSDNPWGSPEPTKGIAEIRWEPFAIALAALLAGGWIFVKAKGLFVVYCVVLAIVSARLYRGSGKAREGMREVGSAGLYIIISLLSAIGVVILLIVCAAIAAVAACMFIMASGGLRLGP